MFLFLTIDTIILALITRFLLLLVVWHGERLLDCVCVCVSDQVGHKPKF